MSRRLVIIGMLILLASSGRRVCAQQAPLPMPSGQAQLETCRDYTRILLNNSMQYEALAKELGQQKAVLEKELIEVKAKLQDTETPVPAPKGTN